MKEFRGRVAVITGASSGIGRALSVALAERGCDLALVDVAQEGLAQTAASCAAAGAKVSTHRVDVSSRPAMEALPVAVEAEHGRVDIVVNNAGVALAGSLEEQELDDIAWLLGVNVWGVIYGCKLFLPLLRRSDDAYIVNLSSMFGLVGVPGASTYCLSKFGVRGFSEAIAAELVETNVSVMSVHPGGVATNIARDGRFGGDGRGHARAVKYFAQRGASPARAAARIIEGMERGASRQLITPESFLTDALKRVLPVVPPRLLARLRRAFDQRR